jgi:hypothetical protein
LGEFKRLHDDFGGLVSCSVIPFALMGVVADVLFNVIYGSVIFRELPREAFFTQRVKRWSRAAEAVAKEGHDLSRREKKGVTWKGRLNSIMPGHV